MPKRCPRCGRKVSALYDYDAPEVGPVCGLCFDQIAAAARREPDPDKDEEHT